MFFFFFFFDDDINKLGEKYYQNGMFNKLDILKKIDELKSYLFENAKKDMRKSAYYYARLDDGLNRFSEIVNESHLIDFEEKNEWVYTIKISEFEIGLYLKKVNIKNPTKDNFFLANYKFLSYKFDLKTIDDYAKLIDVTPIAVRQWIRRGKIRGAKKYGNEWRVSELALPVMKEYKKVNYHWENVLYDLPKVSFNLNDYTDISIEKDEKGKLSYLVTCKKKDNLDNYIITNDEREILESYLIGNDEVQNDSIIIYE